MLNSTTLDNHSMDCHPTITNARSSGFRFSSQERVQPGRRPRAYDDAVTDHDTETADPYPHLLTTPLERRPGRVVPAATCRPRGHSRGRAWPGRFACWSMEFGSRFPRPPRSPGGGLGGQPADVDELAAIFQRLAGSAGRAATDIDETLDRSVGGEREARGRGRLRPGSSPSRCRTGRGPDGRRDRPRGSGHERRGDSGDERWPASRSHCPSGSRLMHTSQVPS